MSKILQNQIVGRRFHNETKPEETFHCVIDLFIFSDNGHYNCMWLHKRTANVLEMQFGRRPSTVASFELCDYNNFWSKTWTTIASK